MQSDSESWRSRLLYWLRFYVRPTRSRPDAPGGHPQHYVTCCGLFLEWNDDGWELSWYRNWGARRSWVITRTRSGKRIQDRTP